MRPQEHSNQFVLKADPDDDLRDRLLKAFWQELDSRSPRSLDVSGDTISFRGGVFRLVSSWNLLAPIGRGEIAVGTTESGLAVSYRISFRELIVVVTVMILTMMFLILSSEGVEKLPVIASLLGIGWLYMVTASIAFAIMRFNGFVRKCAMSAGATEIQKVKQ